MVIQEEGKQTTPHTIKNGKSITKLRSEATS